VAQQYRQNPSLPFRGSTKEFSSADSDLWLSNPDRRHCCLSVAALKSLVVLTAICGSAIQRKRTVDSSRQQFNNFYIADIDIISSKIQRTYFCFL
jgi:hypothetical protein